MNITNPTNEQRTPRTDESVNDTALENKNHPHTDWVTATFARQLETELAEANRKANPQALFDVLKHGDDDHRQWLNAALCAYFDGTEIPKPYGKGTKEMLEATKEQIALLQSENHQLREALIGIQDCGNCTQANVIATKALSQSKPAPVVPWSICEKVLNQFKLCFDDARSYGPGDADIEYQEAIDLLQSYAPKDKEESKDEN